MTASMTELRPPPTLPPIPPLQASKRPSTAGYWVAAVVAVLGLTAASSGARSASATPKSASTASTAWPFPAQRRCR